MKLNEIATEADIGCLFLLGDTQKKYIYVGLQPNNQRDKEEVPTFYSLDDIETGTPGTDLTGREIVDFFNMSKQSPGDALLQIVESDVFSQYKKGIPAKLRILPGDRSAPRAFYKISGNEVTPEGTPKGTPEEFETNKEIEQQKLNEQSATYVSRIGSVGPSVRNIAKGKIADITKFIKDYTAMTIKNIDSVPVQGDVPVEGFVFPDEKPVQGSDEEPVEGIVFPDEDEGPVLGPPQPLQEKPIEARDPDQDPKGGKKTKRRRKYKKSKTYKNKPYIA